MDRLHAQQVDLVRQMKELMVDEERFGSTEMNDNLTSTVPSSKISVSNSEALESEQVTDGTSISSNSHPERLYVAQCVPCSNQGILPELR